MTFDGSPPPPRPGEMSPGSPGPDAPRAEGMHPEARRQYALEQQMMEAKLEAMRSHRQQSQARVGRVVNLLLVFAIAGAVEYYLLSTGVSGKNAVLAAVGTLVVLSAWWAYRKPY